MNRTVLLFLAAGACSAETTAPIWEGAQDARSAEGYILPSTMDSTVRLLDRAGVVAHEWVFAFEEGNKNMVKDNGGFVNGSATVHAELAGNGDLIRSSSSRDALTDTVWSGGGGGSGHFERVSWDGEVVWSYTLDDGRQRAHHGFTVMPNGNVLAIVWQKFSRAEAIAMGRQAELVGDDGIWMDKIVELQPVGSSARVVWEWRSWEHVGAGEGKIDINHNEVNVDLTHVNSLSYHAGRDQIALSVHGYSEIWVIDHSLAATESAAGDLLFRWGNPEAYGAGNMLDRRLSWQHDVRWITDGIGQDSLTIFNNGPQTDGLQASSLVEIYPDWDGSAYHGAQETWSWMASEPGSFWSPHISGAVRLPNGNTLAVEGATADFSEVGVDGSVVWSADSVSFSDRPTQVFTVRFYGADADEVSALR